MYTGAPGAGYARRQINGCALNALTHKMTKALQQYSVAGQYSNVYSGKKEA